MLFRKSVVFILTLLLVATVVPVQAQDGGLPADQQALLDIVTAAVDNFNSLDSYRYSGEQTTAQTIESGIGIRAVTIEQTTAQTMSGTVAIEGENVNSTQTVSQTIESRVNTRDPETITMDFELVSLDGEIYLRFPVVPEGTRALLPGDWINASEASGYEGLAALNMEAFSELVFQTLPLYELSSDNVLEVEELESATVRGQETRVFRVVIDPALALGSSSEQLASIGNFDSELLEAMLADATAELIINVGAEDNLIYQLGSNIVIDFESDDFQGSNISLDQTTTSTFNIVEFNPEVDISVPEPEPPAEEPTTEPDEEATDTQEEPADDSSE
jgi:hypothetical protein